jgi:hypothetical protein
MKADNFFSFKAYHNGSDVPLSMEEKEATLRF